MQADCDLDRTDLGRLGRHDEVASQRELKATPDADSLDAGDDGGRVLAEGSQRPGEVPVENVSSVGVREHRVEIGSRGEVPQGAAQDDGARAFPLRPLESLDELAVQRPVHKVVRGQAHGQDGYGSVHECAQRGAAS
jgi:hypothetical protein